MPAASGWDTADTLSVDLAEERRRRSPARAEAAAQQGATLSLVDSELLAYEIGDADGGNAYNLTGLARGLPARRRRAHSTGAPFARLDGAVVKYDLPDT